MYIYICAKVFVEKNLFFLVASNLILLDETKRGERYLAFSPHICGIKLFTTWRISFNKRFFVLISVFVWNENFFKLLLYMYIYKFINSCCFSVWFWLNSLYLRLILAKFLSFWIFKIYSSASEQFETSWRILDIFE